MFHGGTEIGLQLSSYTRNSLINKLLSVLFGKAQLPQVTGSLLSGFLLGPAVLGIVTEAIFGIKICLMPSVFLNKLAELGVVIIMFSAGMGTSVRDIKTSGKSGFLVALCGVLLPLAMGAAVMHFLANEHSSIMSAVFLGTVLTATSVSITVETLRELGKLSTRVGNTILTAAIIDDILGLVCLAIVSGLAGAKVNIGLTLLKPVLFLPLFCFAAFCTTPTLSILKRTWVTKI